jgi:hypothetical protein
MRLVLIAAGVLVVAGRLHAQSASTTTASSTTAPAAATAAAAPAVDTGAPPPLVKSVTVEAGDSPMVRAAKRALAARVAPGQRRVVSLTTSNTRGRVSVSTGPAEGPVVPPAPTSLYPMTKPESQQTSTQREASRLAAEKRAAAMQDRLKQLAAEEAVLASEADEPYGHAMDEDQVEKRLTEIQAERKRLQESKPPV